MSWLGTPFLDNRISEPLSLSINHIPDLVLQTSFSWETVISSFIAGVIPSLFAYFAIKKNFELAKYQSDLLEKKDFAQIYRAAIAEHITDIRMYLFANQQWILQQGQAPKDIAALKRGVTPHALIAPMEAAEKSKNKIMLLTGIPEGNDVLKSLGEVQHKMQLCIKNTASLTHEQDEFNKSVNDFMYECHLFLNSR
ncbi:MULTISPECIES: hypothetical protein [Rahnella]|uniref:hypothetical protein n=1 Tax=Rahnella TaxID=34037 RepID=UPI003F6DBF82